MDSEESGIWTLDKHLAHGRAAADEISLLPADSIASPRVCFHLSPISNEDDDRWGMEAKYCVRAQAEFAQSTEDFDVDYVGGISGIEAWQYVLPNTAWLERTIPVISDVAAKSGMTFVGWSFEPPNGPFRSVSPTLNVFDGTKLSELPTGSDAESFSGLRDWLKRKLGG